MTLAQKGGDASFRLASCELLGTEYQFLDYADREVRVEQDGFHYFAGIIRKHSGYQIYFPSPMDYHPDHRAVAALG